MQDKKFYQKAIKFLLVVIVFCLSSEVQAANYTIGIIGVGDRSGKQNLGNYINLDDPNLQDPMINLQVNFVDILTTELQSLGLDAIDKTEYAKESRTSEVKTQEFNKLLAQLDKGIAKDVVKLSNEKLDYVLYGYISNFTVTHREAFGTSNISVRADLVVKIVDTATKKIVCVATGKGESASHGEGSRKAYIIGGEKIPEVCWNEALDKALNQVVGKIKKRI